MANYRQPRRFNVVSMLMILVLLGGGYWLYVFFPVYWDAWTVDHQLRECAAAMYQVNKLAEPDRSTQMRVLLQKAQADSIRLAHITDPDFDVRLELTGDEVKLIGEYTVVVRHPIANWTTTVKMHREEHANVKQVHWE